MKKAFWITLAVLVIIQFINSRLPETSVAGDKDLAVAETVPSDVMELMKNACYNCHSMETTYPWYSYVAPVKWLIKSDILGARHYLNFTRWADYTQKVKLKKLDDIHEEIEKGDMPPSKYTMMHANARLTEANRQKIINWADTAYSKYSR